MPINIIGSMVLDGPEVLPGWEYIKSYGPAVAFLAGIKYYFGGSKNDWDRDMHGRVFMITGGTSGVGAQVAYQLASKGAQVILLVRTVESLWIVDFVEDLRDKTGNFLIYAENCDLADLYSVRKFATKWLDNTPPRRLDGIVCCAAETLPLSAPRQLTKDGVERQIGVNYLGHYHLLTLLSPVIRVQPPDRDVRVIITTCASLSLAEIDLDDMLWEQRRYPAMKPWKVYGTSKMYLSLFAKLFQRSIDAFERKDKTPCNVRLITVNPGVLRTPSTRRFLSMGSIFGLLVYWVLFPIWFLFLKSAYEGLQSVFYAINAKEFAQMDGGQHVHECSVVRPSRSELNNEELQDKLYKMTAEHIDRLEKQSAKARKLHKGDDKVTGKSKVEEEVYTVPKTEEELEAKLDALRSGMARTRQEKLAKNRKSKK